MFLAFTETLTPSFTEPTETDKSAESDVPRFPALIRESLLFVSEPRVKAPAPEMSPMVPELLRLSLLPAPKSTLPGLPSEVLTNKPDSPGLLSSSFAAPKLRLSCPDARPALPHDRGTVLPASSDRDLEPVSIPPTVIS